MNNSVWWQPLTSTCKMTASFWDTTLGMQPGMTWELASHSSDRHARALKAHRRISTSSHCNVSTRQYSISLFLKYEINAYFTFRTRGHSHSLFKFILEVFTGPLLLCMPNTSIHWWNLLGAKEHIIAGCILPRSRMAPRTDVQQTFNRGTPC